MFNKLDLLLTTSSHIKRKITSIELVEPVDSVERVLPLTSSFLTTPNSSERSRIITTPRLKKCHKILRTLIPPDQSDKNKIDIPIFNLIATSFSDLNRYCHKYIEFDWKI
jgi:hypothetical protein